MSAPVAPASWSTVASALLVAACAWLDSAELIRMRRVSQRWAAASRMPASWRSSHMRLSAAKGLRLAAAASILAATAPHLRSLAITAEESPPLPLHSLPMLECVVLRYPPSASAAASSCISSRFLSALSSKPPAPIALAPPSAEVISSIETLLGPSVRPVRAGQGRDKEGYAIALCGRLGAAESSVLPLSSAASAGVSAAAAVSSDWGCTGKIFSVLSCSGLAESLVVLRLPPSVLVHGGSLDEATMKRFTALEELHVASWVPDTLTPSTFAAIASLPKLRLLSLGGPKTTMFGGGIDDEMLDALLANEGFTARVEALSLGRGSFDSDRVHCVLHRCNKLLSFALCDHKGLDHEPSEEQFWNKRAARPAGLDVRFFLTAVELVEARYKLAHLRFERCGGYGGSLSKAKDLAVSVAQLRRRWPALLSAQIVLDPKKEAAEDETSKREPKGWMPPAYPLKDGNLKAPKAMTIKLPRLGAFGEVDLFQLVRTLKVARGLPLSDVEKNYSARL